MSRFGRKVDCTHARRWAALAPDGELSELEQRSLRSHLRVCASCTSFAREVEGLTLLLRSEELVSPSSIAAVTRVAPRRHALLARARPVAAAAAVAVMALGVASRAPLPMDERDSNLRTTTPAVASDQLEMRSLRVRAVIVERSPLDLMPSIAANAPA